MSVKKIFIVLITVVVCIVLGAFVLNIVMPNTVAQVVNSVEDGIHSATGLSFDFNGDGKAGGDGGTTTVIDSSGNKATTGVGVEGFGD